MDQPAPTTVIEYLQEENRVLREQTGRRRLRFTDDQRRRLAVKAKVLGRRALAELDTLVMPDCPSKIFRTREVKRKRALVAAGVTSLTST